MYSSASPSYKAPLTNSCLLIRPDCRCIEIVKYYCSKLPSSREVMSFTSPLFNCRRGGLLTVLGVRKLG